MTDYPDDEFDAEFRDDGAGKAAPARGAAQIHRLTYVSEAVIPPHEAMLSKIARVSQRNNPGRQLTGVLILCGGEFLQVLEGAREDVTWLYDVIGRDPRHRDVTTVASESVPDRQYPAWSMGCFVFRPDDLPGGFFFEDRSGKRRLRIDAMERAADVLRVFDSERLAGFTRRFEAVAAH